MDGVTENAIELERVRRVYRGTRGRGDRIAVDDVSLTIAAGARISLLGPNGSGKSTLLGMIATLDRPTSGAIRWFGESEAAKSVIRRRLGVVFQTPALDPLLTVRENLRLQAAIFGLRPPERDQRLRELCEALRIDDRMDDRVGSLSGGLARRVDLARALLTNPTLLLLDEPTSGLDPVSRHEFLSALERRHAQGGLTVLMTTHLMDEAERSQRVIMMDHGRLVADGAPSQLRREMIAGDEVMLRAPAAHEAALRSIDGSVRIIGDEAIAKAPLRDSTWREAVTALLNRGVSVSVGPPTLNDVFIAKTGRALESGESS